MGSEEEKDGHSLMEEKGFWRSIHHWCSSPGAGVCTGADQVYTSRKRMVSSCSVVVVVFTS